MEATNLICDFKLHEFFDCETILLRLIEFPNIPTAKKLCGKNKDY